LGTPDRSSIAAFESFEIKAEASSQHFAQPAFHHLLIWALAAGSEPGLELADAHRVLGLGLFDADCRGSNEASAKPVSAAKSFPIIESVSFRLLENTLVSAGIGFLAGLLAEPLRMIITNGVKARQMRTAIYRDAIRQY
jgi:hypothetical protein